MKNEQENEEPTEEAKKQELEEQELEQVSGSRLLYRPRVLGPLPR